MAPECSPLPPAPFLYVKCELFDPKVQCKGYCVCAYGLALLLMTCLPLGKLFHFCTTSYLTVKQETKLDSLHHPSALITMAVNRADRH